MTQPVVGAGVFGLYWLLDSSATWSLNFLISARLDRLSDNEQNQPVVLPMLVLRIPTGLSRFVVKTKRLLCEAIHPLPALVGLMRDLTLV